MARSIHVSGICLLQVKSAQIPPHPIDKSRNGHLARKLGNNERIVSRSGVPPPAYKRNSPGAGKPLRLTRKLRLITQMSYFRRQVFVSRAPFVRRSRDRTSDDNSVIPSGAAPSESQSCNTSNSVGPTREPCRRTFLLLVSCKN